MKKLIMGLMLLMSMSSVARCIISDYDRNKRFVCYNGSRLDGDRYGVVWYASRRCFLSSSPCCFYEATHYGRYMTYASARRALARCNYDYPHRGGDFD